MSGLFEGMALAAVTGRAWRAMTAAHAGFAQPTRLERAALFGIREIDDAEQVLIDTHALMCTTEPDALAAHLAEAASVYAHLDMDVHAALNVRANADVVPGGPDIETVRAGLVGLKNLKCLAITGLEPAAADAATAL